MLTDIDSQFKSAQMLFDYVTKPKQYNIFLIDELESSDIIQLRKYIDDGNKVEAIRMYRKIDRDMDAIRDKYCYNILEYKSSFRGIAKDLYRELKDSWLIHTDTFRYIAHVLRFISTSDYYIIREFLIKRSLSMYMYKDIPLNPDDFYCGYIPLEVFMDYAIKLYRLYTKENNYESLD